MLALFNFYALPSGGKSKDAVAHSIIELKLHSGSVIGNFLFTESDFRICRILWADAELGRLRTRQI